MIVTVGILGFITTTGFVLANGKPTKVDVCHATGSQNNPYVLVNVSVHSVDDANGLNGHGDHQNDAWDSFTFQDVNYPGQGDMDSCRTDKPTDVPPTDIPTSTEEPTTTPTDTPFPTNIPSPTWTSSETSTPRPTDTPSSPTPKSTETPRPTGTTTVEPTPWTATPSSVSGTPCPCVQTIVIQGEGGEDNDVPLWVLISVLAGTNAAWMIKRRKVAN